MRTASLLEGLSAQTGPTAAPLDWSVHWFEYGSNMNWTNLCPLICTTDLPVLHQFWPVLESGSWFWSVSVCFIGSCSLLMSGEQHWIGFCIYLLELFSLIFYIIVIIVVSFIIMSITAIKIPNSYAYIFIYILIIKIGDKCYSSV